jgi:hypothetical protein
MWSQIARTVILAHIKKENRDKKNGAVFQAYLENKTPPKSHVLERFLEEASEICKYNKDYLIIIEAIKELYDQDDKPGEGLITKLVDRSKLPRSTVAGFLKMVRLRSHDFSDSPVNEEHLRKRSTTTEDQDIDGNS